MLGVKVGEQNEARKHMIAELAEANHRLEEMIAENTGLQAQLLTQAREAGAGDERQRMAREIHDTIAQGLTGIVTQLEAVQQTSNDAERERRIDNAKRLARDSLAEARRSVQALRPQALENSRLPEALADEVARWSVTSGVTGDVETTGQARALHPEVEVTLLRVAQEALANVAKHAERLPGRGHAVLHGGRGQPGRARRRSRVRRGPSRGSRANGHLAGVPGRGRFRADRDAPAGQHGWPGSWRSSRSPGRARPYRPASPPFLSDADKAESK